jgi:hypothetical protein
LYITSRKEVVVSAGQEAEISATLEVDSAARSRLASEALEAYSNKQYDRAINAAKALVAVDAKHAQALTVLAQSYFMNDDFSSLTEFGSRAIEAGGRLEILVHDNGVFTSSSMHPGRLVLTTQTLSFGPAPAQAQDDMSFHYRAFTASLAALGTADVSGNRDNEIYLSLVFVDPNKPKKPTTLRFLDRESYFVEKQKNTAGGFVRYIGHTMVSRRQAYGAMAAIAALLNRAKGSMGRK